MTPPSRDGVVLAIIEALQQAGSWCGETHIQKTAYFVSQLERESLDFSFVLYKHGPFSFEMHDELTVMRVRSLLCLEATFPYGSRLRLTDSAQRWTTENRPALSRFASAISFAAEKLSPHGVATLERLATALFFTGVSQPEKRVASILAAKPHISREQANAAVDEVDQILAEWRRSQPKKKKMA
ncbi:MAG TPA: hypothetical protein VK581_10365 [Chthoniobacterales bacterium]|nr:hypothetical protein [Chthoniobacterales bacterium]